VTLPDYPRFKYFASFFKQTHALTLPSPRGRGDFGGRPFIQGGEGILGVDPLPKGEGIFGGRPFAQGRGDFGGRPFIQGGEGIFGVDHLSKGEGTI